MVRCAHQGRAAGEGDRAAEVIVFSTVAGRQLRLLRPGGAGAHEDIGRAGVHPRSRGEVLDCAHERHVAVERHMAAKLVALSTVGGG